MSKSTRFDPRQCQHCGVSFVMQTNAGSLRSYCYSCLPKYSQLEHSQYMRLSTALNAFKNTGRHTTCCDLERNIGAFGPPKPKRCTKCGDSFFVSISSHKTMCPPCNKEWKLGSGLRRTVLATKRECAWCYAEFFPHRVDSRYCSSECRSASNLHYRKHRSPNMCHIPQCRYCGNIYAWKGAGQELCEPCALMRERERNGVNGERRLAAVKAGDADIHWRTLGPRDGWKCHICGGKVPQRSSAKDPDGAEVDHLIPIADGGEHVWSNVALAHRRCNNERRTGGEVQLRLVG